MKPNKVLCFMLLFAILGVDPAQRTIGGYACSCNQLIETLRLCNSCIVHECETKDVHGHGPSNINLGLFVLLLLCLPCFITISLY